MSWMVPWKISSQCHEISVWDATAKKRKKERRKESQRKKEKGRKKGKELILQIIVNHKIKAMDDTWTCGWLLQQRYSASTQGQKAKEKKQNRVLVQLSSHDDSKPLDLSIVSMVQLIFFASGVTQAKGWSHHWRGVFAHANRFFKNRRRRTEGLPTAHDHVASATTFPRNCFLIHGKECAVVNRTWVLLLRPT